MYSNGLLEYYKKGYFKEGFLDVSRLKIVEGRSSMFDTCVSCKSPVGVFYKKYHNYFSKEMADAEILLSQIYNSLGLTSAVYLPVEDRGRRFLLSNSVDGQNIYQASTYNSVMASHLGCNREQIDNFMNKQIVSSPTGKQIVDYFNGKNYVFINYSVKLL